MVGLNEANCACDYLKEKMSKTRRPRGQSDPLFSGSRARFLPDEQGSGSYRGLSAPYLSQPANHGRGLPHFPASFPAIQKSKSGQVRFTVFFALLRRLPWMRKKRREGASGKKKNEVGHRSREQGAGSKERHWRARAIGCQYDSSMLSVAALDLLPQ